MQQDNNIVWQKNKVTYEERCAITHQKGIVVWLTGLSGAGKSTIAVEVEKLLVMSGYLTYLLDGDNLRHGLNANLGFSEDDRLENVRRVAEVANLMEDCGIVVLATFISPMKEMRDLVRSKIKTGHFMEVYIKADIDECIRRDPKGLYKKAIKGEIKQFTGITSEYELPCCPDIVLDTQQFTRDECVKQLYNNIIQRII